MVSGGNTRGLRYDWMLYRGILCAEGYVLNERRVFHEGAQFNLSDHYALLGFLDVHPCYGLSWRKGLAAARAGRGQLVQLRDRAILLESRQAKESLRLGMEELSSSRRRAGTQDTLLFQTAQATAVRRRRDARASAHRKAFGPGSFFAPNLHAEFALATGCPDAPHGIDIRGFESLRQTAWADLRSFLSVGLRRRGYTCYVNSVAHVLLRVPAMGAWLEHHRGICIHREGCLLCVLAATRAQLSDSNAWKVLPELAVRRGLVGDAFEGPEQHDASEFFVFCCLSCVRLSSKRIVMEHGVMSKSRQLSPRMWSDCFLLCSRRGVAATPARSSVCGIARVTRGKSLRP